MEYLTGKAKEVLGHQVKLRIGSVQKENNFYLKKTIEIFTVFDLIHINF